jgi:hypothetical protein
MRIIILISILFLSFQSIGQSKKIGDNIKKIDNSQFEINHDTKAAFSIKSPGAMKLIKSGKAAAEKLIASLNDSDKNIIAHFVLCHIYFKHVSFAGPKIISTSEGDVSKYYLGQEHGEGLIISELKGKKYIEAKDLEKIKVYWKEKIKH